MATNNAPTGDPRELNPDHWTAPTPLDSRDGVERFAVGNDAGERWIATRRLDRSGWDYELATVDEDEEDAGPPWRPTHRITFTPSDGGAPQVETVMLVDGSGYTRDEWDSCSAADWELTDGEWSCGGETTPGGQTGEVVVERLDE